MAVPLAIVFAVALESVRVVRVFVAHFFTRTLPEPTQRLQTSLAGLPRRSRPMPDGDT